MEPRLSLIMLYDVVEILKTMIIWKFENFQDGDDDIGVILNTEFCKGEKGISCNNVLHTLGWKTLEI